MAAESNRWHWKAPGYRRPLYMPAIVLAADAAPCLGDRFRAGFSRLPQDYPRQVLCQASARMTAQDWELSVEFDWRMPAAAGC